jgi:hypothetical protein
MSLMIPISYVRDTVKAFYKIDSTTKNDAFIDKKILEASNNIDSEIYIKTGVYDITVCDSYAPLPCGFKNLIALIAPPDSENGGCVPIVYSSLVSPCHGVYDVRNSAGIYTFDFNQLKFSEDFPYEHLKAYCEVREVDEQGFPLLFKKHEYYYEMYALYWTGLMLKDARYAEFKGWKNIRRNIVHNEIANNFTYSIDIIQAVVKSVGNPVYTWGGGGNNFATGQIDYSYGKNN